MKTWNEFYGRKAFSEGYVSAFDLFGAGSSYRLSAIQNHEADYVKNSIGNAFSEVAKHLNSAARKFTNQYELKETSKSK